MSGGADEGIGTKVSVLGDKEYKEAMADIGRQLAVVNSEMRASQSAYDSQDASIEKLQDKVEKLTGVYGAQAEKVRLIAEQLAKAEQEYGENSKQADNLRIALNNANTALNKTGNELVRTNGQLDAAAGAAEDAADGSGELAGAAYEAADAIDGQGDAAGDASEKTSNFSGQLSAAGNVAKQTFVVALEATAVALAAVGAAAVAAAGKAFDFAKGAGSMADELLTTSAMTGVSTEKLQEWAYASELIDVSVDTIAGSMTRMTRNMGEANKGSEGAKAKFAALGLSIYGVNGELKEAEELFFEAIDALGEIENQTERDAIAMDLFGKSAKELNPLIDAGSDALAALGQEARDMGAVFSDDAIAAMGSFDDSIRRVDSTGRALKNSIGLVVIPAFQPLMDKASQAMGSVAKAIQEGLSPEDMEGIVELLATFVDESLETITGMMTDALPLVMGAMSALLSSLAQRLPGMIQTLLPAATKLLQSILDAMVANVGPLAAMAVDLVTSIATFLLENLDKLIDAAAGIVIGLIDGMTEALPKLIPLAIEMLAKLAVALVSNLATLAAKAPEIIGALVKGLLDTDWLKIGKDLLLGLAGGISSAFSDANKLADAYREQFGATQEAYDAFKAGLEKADLNLQAAVDDAEGKKQLATELLALYNELEEKEIQTDADLTLMAAYAQQIAQLYPQLGQYIDPVTGLFAENTSAIQNNIDALAQYALIQGYQSHLNELGSLLAQANIEIGKQTEGLKAAEEEWERLKGIQGDVAELYNKLDSARATSDVNKRNLLNENLTEIYNTLKDIGGIEDPLKGYVDVLGDGTVVLKDSMESWRAYETIMHSLKNVHGEASDHFQAMNTVYEENQETLAALNREADETREKMDGITGHIKDGTQALNEMPAAAIATGEAYQQAGEDISAGGDAALEGAQKFEDAAEMMAGADEAAEDIAASVSGAGDDVAAAASEILVATHSIQAAEAAAVSAQEAVAIAMQAIDADSAAALIVMQAVSDSISLTVGAMLVSVANALTGGTNEVAWAGESMAQAVADAVSEELSQANGMTIGVLFAQQVGAGITDEKPEVEKTATGLGADALFVLWQVVGSGGSNFEPIGTAIADGVAKGIRDGTSNITSAARDAARAADAAARKELGIASPARKGMEVGEWYAEGVALGVEARMERVLDSVRGLSAMADTEMGMRPGHASGMQAFEIDYERLGDAVADSFIRKGIGDTVIEMDGREVGRTVEPSVSRETYERANRTAAGRSARMVFA